MFNLAIVAVGGAAGSVCRYLVGMATLRLFGPNFPWGTLAVNIVGSLAIGICVELIARRFEASMDLRLLVITGFLGGFTTFSAFSLDVISLFERGALLQAGLYVASSILFSLLAVVAGLALMRSFV